MTSCRRREPAGRCPSPRRPGWLVTLVFLGVGFTAPIAAEVDLDSLWLPSSHQRHLPRLYDAARHVRALPGCEEFIEGTSQLDRTRPDHPVFRLTCRDADGETYSVLVDGPSQEVLDDTRPGGRVSFEQLRVEYEQERKRLEELVRREQELADLEMSSREAERLRREWLQWWEAEHQRRARLWTECRALLDERVGRMQSLEWLTETLPEAELSQEPELESHPPVSFVIDFNAESYYGEPLAYRAFCAQEDQGEAMQLDVRPRREQ